MSADPVQPEDAQEPEGGAVAGGGLAADAPEPETPALGEPEASPAVIPEATAPSAAPARSGRRTGVAIIAMSLVAVLASSALFLSGWTLGRQTAMTPGTPSDEAQLFQPFWDTYRAVTDRYAGGDVDRKALVEGAIKGMIGALEDPYSQYLTSEEFKQSLQGISGEFEGIGATIGTVDGTGVTSGCAELGTNCRMVIVAPIKDAPAERAGLLPGDVVTMIDGRTLDGLTLEEARSRVRGPKGTVVVLTIERGGTARDIEVTRAVIVTPEVESEDLAGGTVGYVRLSGFSDHAAEEFDLVIAEDVKAGRTKFIVDLRGNPGGFVTAARDIASQFLAGGTIFWQEDADGSLVETVAKPGGSAVDPAIKLVLLVDGGSASASEIVAGALHDRERATLVGTTTFGKGTVQQWTQLEGDSGGFRLTIAKWLTPDKTWIHGTGIEPDVLVEDQPEKPGDDPVLDAALEALAAAG
ncbi:MAG TPA: S41 family peptidase [Candidatus Limnocylindrales bacterium]|nr:S41 family peptidase [Candidatus Limnocylindrales bacterium]